MRGLNAPHRRDDVREMVTSTHATIICLQETKLQQIDDFVITSMLGSRFTANYSYLSASGIRGGILVAVSDDHFNLASTTCTANTITVTVKMLDDGAEWSLTSVYGPQGDPEKELFIEELKGLKSLVSNQWLLTGDFNMIDKAEDKNYNRLNRRIMGTFQASH